MIYSDRTSNRKNFGLNDREFESLKQDLILGNEYLFEHIFITHMDDCIGFLKSKYKVSFETAYDVTMDTIIEFRKRLIANKVHYGNLRYLFTTMASQNLLRWLKKEEKHKNLAIPDTSDEVPKEHVMNILNESWSKMGDLCQQLLKAYYYDQLSFKQIEKRMNKPSTALRKQKQRCFDRLKKDFLNRYHFEQ